MSENRDWNPSEYGFLVTSWDHSFFAQNLTANNHIGL